MNMLNEATIRAADGIPLVQPSMPSTTAGFSMDNTTARPNMPHTAPQPSMSNTAVRPSTTSMTERLSRPTTASAARGVQSRLNMQAHNNTHRHSPSLSRDLSIPARGPLASSRSRLAGPANSVAAGRHTANPPAVNLPRPATAVPIANSQHGLNVSLVADAPRVSGNIPAHPAPPAPRLPIRTSKTTTTIKKGFRNLASTLIPSRRRAVAQAEGGDAAPSSFNELQDGENITIVHEEKVYEDPALQAADNENAEPVGDGVVPVSTANYTNKIPW